MDMSINNKKLISQFEPFEKLKILILFGYGAWTWDIYEHVWNLDMGNGTCMNNYEIYMAHGTFWHGALAWDMYEHVWNLDMGPGHGICMNMYETWTWDILTHGKGKGHVWTCMKLGHGACAWNMYEHVWNLNMGHFDTWQGQGACMNMYETWTWDIWTWTWGVFVWFLL
jgi:hypothetical protein